MTIALSLTEDDFLTSILYTASKKKTVKKTRTNTWLVVTASFLMLGFVFMQIGNSFFKYYFFGCSVLSFFFYPLYQRAHYKKHYAKHVKENVKNKIGKLCTIELTADYILTKDAIGEGKLNTSEIAEVNEIGTHIFVKMTTGDSLVIPKRLIDEIEFWKTVNNIIEDKKVIINKELDWRWK